MLQRSASPRSGALIPGALWRDNNGVHINAHGGGVLWHEGVYHWFGEHKIEGTAGNVAHVGVHAYTSTDLYHWKDSGIALAVSSDPAHELAAGCILERPKVIYNRATRRFVMGFHLEPKDAGYAGARYGVAVSDQVTGPYRFVRSVRPNAGYWPMDVPDDLKRPLPESELRELAALNLVGGPVAGYPRDRIFRRDFAGGQMSRDMTLFVDDDGVAYHFYASEDNGVLHVAELSADYLSHTGRYTRIFAGAFREAPAVFKRKGRYYLFTSHCTGWFPNPARAATAESIWGPWTDLGDPVRGTDSERETTFNSQSTFVLPVAGRDDAFIFMADRWCPDDAIDGRYVWLPIEFDADGVPFISWSTVWDLSVFDR